MLNRRRHIVMLFFSCLLSLGASLVLRVLDKIGVHRTLVDSAEGHHFIFIMVTILLAMLHSSINACGLMQMLTPSGWRNGLIRGLPPEYMHYLFQKLVTICNLLVIQIPTLMIFGVTTQWRGLLLLTLIALVMIINSFCTTPSLVRCILLLTYSV